MEKKKKYFCNMIGWARLKMDQSDLLFVTRCYSLLSSCMLLGNNSNISPPILRFFFLFMNLSSLTDKLETDMI